MNNQFKTFNFKGFKGRNPKPNPTFQTQDLGSVSPRGRKVSSHSPVGSDQLMKTMRLMI